jgi:CHAD domain-containing protein
LSFRFRAARLEGVTQVFPMGQTAILLYAREQISGRLGRLAVQAHAVAERPEPESVHDLRVAIRRFAQGLRVFASLLPPAETRRIRKRLRKLMSAAGALRDRAITIELLKEADLKNDDPLLRKLASERKRAEAVLVEEVRKLHRRDFSAKWRAALQLVPE